MWSEDRSTKLETVSGSAGRRLRALLAIGVLGGLVSATAARGEPAFLASLAAEVVGSERAAPGGIATFRIDVRSASPRMTVTVYEQLGSSLNLVGDRRDCIISAMP